MHIALIGALLPLAGCLPEPNFPDEPIIEFQSFDLSAGGGRELVIGFSDGDGNVGLAQADTLAPFCPTCEFHQNLKCEYQEWRDTAWVEIELNPVAGQIPFYYRVPSRCAHGSKPRAERHHQHRHEFVVFEQPLRLHAVPDYPV